MTVLTLKWSLKKRPLTLAWHDQAKIEPSIMVDDGQPTRNPTIIAVAPAGLSSHSFNYIQVSAQPTWIIPHNLGKIPTIVLMDLSGSVVEASVTHLDLNTTMVEFSTPFAGQAQLYG